MRRGALVLLLALGALLGGCAGLPAPPGWVRPGEEPVARTLAYARRLHTLSDDALQREYTALSRPSARKKDVADRLRLALLLMGPDPRLRDDAKAAALLRDIAQDKAADPETKDFAVLLAQVAEERLRRAERCQALAEKGKEAQNRADALQEKLDALKAIERNIINRESNPSVPVKQ